LNSALDDADLISRAGTPTTVVMGFVEADATMAAGADDDGFHAAMTAAKSRADRNGPAEIAGVPAMERGNSRNRR